MTRGILPIRLIGRVSREFFEPLGMHGIDLNQLDRFVPQIMTKRLCIGSGRFKTHDTLF
jgi:hypothetical protein